MTLDAPSDENRGSGNPGDSESMPGVDCALSFLGTFVPFETDCASAANIFAGIEDGTWTWLALSAARSASLLAFNCSIALLLPASITNFEKRARLLPVGGLKRVPTASSGESAPLIVASGGTIRVWRPDIFFVVTNPSLSSLFTFAISEDARIRSG